MNGIDTFLDSFFEQLQHAGLDISTFDLDHVAYQASSPADYDAQKPQFLEVGTEAHEGLIGGRRVAVFKLNSPLQYKKYVIPALELVESKPGQVIPSSWQHAEFVIDGTFEDYMKKYPTLNWDTSSMSRDEFSHLKLNFENGITLKFLYKPILEAVAQG